ncbi:MAG TPA: glycosyltransferase, partial [Candidatus Acidoferrum sp.]|nr:glycosyltransferase [Candidatus Acidoferrum sp.]
GGLERVAMEVSQELAAQGWQTEVITSNCGAATAPREEQQLRLRTRRLAAFEFAHTPFMPSFLWRLLRVKKPAIFHLHLSQAFIPELTWLVAKVRGIPYVVHFHLDVQPSGPLGFLFVLYKHTIQKMVLQGARAVIALSPDQKRLIEKRYHKKPEDVLFLPNGVSEQYLAIGRKAREPHFPLRLLFVGRLAAQKRVDRLIEALQRCTAPVELHIAGDGEERQALKSLVGQCNLRNVVFHGALGGRALADMYRRCDVLVMPSDREGMSLVMLEAMAAGLPVIGSNVPGLREHLADTGVLVNNPSPETFARAIDLFYLHRQEAYEAYSRKSHAKAAELSWAHLTKKIGNLYETIYAPEPVRTSRGLVKLTALAALWWVGFLWLRSVPAVPAVVVDVAGFSFLSIVPGMLSLLLFGLKHLAPFGKLAMAVGLSVLELMVVALLGNTLLPLFGIRQPLSARYLIIELSLLVAGLLVANFVNKTRWELPVRAVRQLFRTRLDRLIAFGPIAFVLLAVCGASSLNNGGSNLWIIALLVGIAAYSVFVSLQAKKLSPSVIPTALFFTSLSLLLMTSLRGWYITGHDIQREFVVFQLAKNSGIWQIASYRDAYNACLSITILPTIFSNLLRVADPYVFKVFFQIIFALCPSIVYLMVRRWLQPALAFAATLYFIAFPTFFTDMPMLSRQEIAFLFVALMFYVIFQAKVALGRRRALFLLLSAGLIISHYSTTYSIVAILLATVFVWPPLCRLANWLARKGRLKHSALNALAHGATELKAISLTMTVLIVLGSFLWTVVLTDTGNNTVGVIRATVAAIGAGFKSEGLRSKDTNYNLLSWQSDDPQLLMNGYLTNVVKPAHQQDLGSYYPSSSYPNPAVLPDSGAMPLTSIGNWVSHLGLDVPNFNDIVRQGSAKLLQVLILIGFIYTLFRRRYAHNLSTDFVALSVGSLIFVASQVVLPVLSVEYGLLRAFQQALMLLGLFTVVGSAVLFSPLAKKLPVALLPTLLAVAFFLSSTGVITQLLGGYGAQLHLNNSGQYYDLYYLHTSEVDGTRWLANQQPRVSTDQVQATVQMSNYIFGQLAPHVQVSPLNDIYPSLIRKDSYVFLGYTNVVLGQSTISYNGTLVNYQYSSAFLDNVKDLIYSNGQVKIYR